MISTTCLISPVVCSVWVASCLISSATTAKPLPASPALAASIDAFRDKRLVWEAIAEICCASLLISSIFCAFSTAASFSWLSSSYITFVFSFAAFEDSCISPDWRCTEVARSLPFWRRSLTSVRSEVIPLILLSIVDTAGNTLSFISLDSWSVVPKFLLEFFSRMPTMCSKASEPSWIFPETDEILFTTFWILSLNFVTAFAISPVSSRLFSYFSVTICDEKFNSPLSFITSVITRTGFAIVFAKSQETITITRIQNTAPRMPITTIEFTTPNASALSAIINKMGFDPPHT